MTTSLNLRAGELVEVLSKREILDTLDSNGRYEDLPFMPEMFQYCGRRLRVFKRAHKTCDFVTNTGGRRLSSAVHLEGVRCDGAAHGGCQAQCMIFWKEVWLKRISDQIRPSELLAAYSQEASVQERRTGGCSEAAVFAASSHTEAGCCELTYVCQATLVPVFTQPLSWWDVRQYIEDYRSGNAGCVRKMFPRFIYRAYDNLINLGIGLGPALRWLYDRIQEMRHGTAYPGRAGEIPSGAPTPTAGLDVRVGELVRTKSYEEIRKTIDTASKNRGLGFSAEMVPYCGHVFRVLSRVTRIIDEKSGKMLTMRNPCIILEGGICQARYNCKTLFCPRATYAYWREIWLERIGDEAPGKRKK